MIPQDTEDFLTLNQNELDMVMLIFNQFALHEFYRDENGKIRKRLMRQRHIWISDKKFFQKNEGKKSIKTLLEKKVIVPHLVGFRIGIKEEYLNQIYNLADNGDWELVKQLSAVWLECG